MRALVTESYPGKAEGRGAGEQGRRSRGRGQTGRSWERRGQTEWAVKMGKDGW